MRPRRYIKDIRGYERWLRKSGFSKKESLILATAWRKLEIGEHTSDGDATTDSNKRAHQRHLS